MPHLPRKKERKPHAPIEAKPVDLNAALTVRIEDKGRRLPLACGTCGARVDPDDQEAIRDEPRSKGYGETRVTAEGGWWRHRWCHAASAAGPPALLALAVYGDRQVFPLDKVLSQACTETAYRVGCPKPYHDLESTAWTDRGNLVPWQHHGPAALVRLRVAVEQRVAELTTPVRSPSRHPCACCGRSHALVDAWGKHQDRVVCATCLTLINRAAPYTPGNRRIQDYAFESAGRAGCLPPRGVQEMLLRYVAPGWGPLDPGGPEVAPWEYCRDLPEPEFSPAEQIAERLAALEASATV